MTIELLLSSVIALVVVGLVLYLVEAYVPMSPPVRTVLRVLVVLILILWLVRLFSVVLPLHAQGLRLTTAAAPVPLAAYAMSNTTDASGNGHTATFLNTMTAPGKYAEGQQFAGGPTGASRMTVPGITFTSGFTLEAWVKFTAITRMVVGTRSPRDTPEYWQAVVYKVHDIVWLAEMGGHISAGLTPQGATASVGVVSPSPVSLNVFHHLAVTYDGVNLALVIDGLQVANRAVTGMVQASTNPIEVGGSGVDGGGLQGVIDDVRIYGRGLTLAELAVDLGTPVDTVHEAVESWDLEVSSQDGGGVVALGNFPKTAALCNLAPLPPPTSVVQNPTTARVTDPGAATRECELTIETFILGLPIHAGYTSTARARGATTVSGPSPVSNAFDRVAVVTPPPAPGSTIIAK